MVANRALTGALRARAEKLGIDIIEGSLCRAFETNGSGITVHLAEGAALSARLLIAADGVNSKLRDMAGIKTVKRDYGQSGIVCTVAHEPRTMAAPKSIFCRPAPLPRCRSNRTRTAPTARRSSGSNAREDAKALVEDDHLAFEQELEQRFSLKLGEIRVADKPRAWPLGLTIARAFVAHRIALAGDAAHGIHPIAGQGLNLGFKDVAALAEVIVEADRLGQDIGALDVLERYSNGAVSTRCRWA